MRILQNTLLYGHSHELTMYMEGLAEKLELKQKSRHYQNYNSQNNGHSLDVHAVHYLDKSVDKMTRINSNSSLLEHDSNKQNKFYLGNVCTRTNTDNQDNSFCISKKAITKNTNQVDSKEDGKINWELGKLRKISAVEYINRDEELETKMSLNK